MINALALPNELDRDALFARSVALGVARRWAFQDSACVNGIKVIADADLIDTASLRRTLSRTNLADESPAGLIALAYLEHGDGFVSLLRGAFSLALWDEKKQRLILAIDRLGIRGLFWRMEGRCLLFSSRIGAIRAMQRDSVSVNPQAILNYLMFSCVPAPLAVDDQTHKLPPGTLLAFESGNNVQKQYWDLEYRKQEDRPEGDWAEEVRESIRAAVHRHLEGCETSRTGAYLSGGTDSSSVVAFQSEKHRPAQTFSIAFEEAGFSEIEFARTTASHFGTKHHERFLAPADASEALDKIAGFYEEPFANSSAIGSYYCAVLAQQQGVTTLLAGDGGDELFAGNTRYAADKRFGLYHSLPVWVRKSFVEPFTSLFANREGSWGLPYKYVRRATIPNPRRILSYGFFLSLPPEEVFDDTFLEQVGCENWLAIPEMHFRRANADSELNRLLYLDMKMTLADNDLRKVSGTAELAGVNVRYPLLDDRLVELSGRIPAQLKLKGFEKRYIFKKAMKDILPRKVLYKKKHGFGVPLAQWLLQEPRMKELLNDLMHDPRTRQRGYFRPRFVERLMSWHQKQPNYYGEIVWYLLALEMWHRRHLESRPETVHAT
jgi:asparagine synthase (glutamine-hydrolysing)